jgi:hypothetical protein
VLSNVGEVQDSGVVVEDYESEMEESAPPLFGVGATRVPSTERGRQARGGGDDIPQFPPTYLALDTPQSPPVFLD